MPRPKPPATPAAEGDSRESDGSFSEGTQNASPAPERTLPPVQTAQSKSVRPRWHFGIRSKSSPKEVLLELYLAMKKLGVHWKPPVAESKDPVSPFAFSHSCGDVMDEDATVNPYRIEARWTPDAGQHAPIYFELSLYKLDGEKRSQQGYLVDFRNVTENEAMASSQRAMLFLEICSKLITELVIQS